MGPMDLEFSRVYMGWALRGFEGLLGEVLVIQHPSRI